MEWLCMGIYDGKSKLEIYEEEEFQHFLPAIFEIVKKEAVKNSITLQDFTFSSCSFENGNFQVSYKQEGTVSFTLDIQVDAEGNATAIHSFVNKE